MTTLIDDSLEMIRATHDGDDLAPEHLYLVQEAVNGHLNDKGKEAFAQLLQQVRSGYVKPWLQGVEHLTRDHEGYVYWKGQEIEHWSGEIVYSERGKIEAQKLAQRCLTLEARGEPINTSTIIWRWKEEAVS